MRFQLTFGACHAIGTQGEGEEGGKSKGSKVQKIAKDEILMVSLPCSARFLRHAVPSLSPLACLCRLRTRHPAAADQSLMSCHYQVNIGSTSCGAQVKKRTKRDFGDGKGEVSVAKIKLLSPVCTRVGEKIALSRRVEKHWRLIGWGEVSDGVTIDLE